MKHIKEFEKLENDGSTYNGDDIKIYYGVIQIERLQYMISLFKSENISYSLYELIDANGEYCVVSVIKTTLSKKNKYLNDKITLSDQFQTAIYITTNFKNITALSVDDIIEKHALHNNMKKYNI